MTVTVTKERYAQLIDAEMKLEALEANGVDNWEWYDEALDDYRTKKEEQEKENDRVP